MCRHPLAHRYSLNAIHCFESTARAKRPSKVINRSRQAGLAEESTRPLQGQSSSCSCHAAGQAEQGAVIGQDEVLDHDARLVVWRELKSLLFSAELEPQWNPDSFCGSPEIAQVIDKIGAPEEIRTPDPQIRSRVMDL
jgi:hypothetical protein